MGVDFARNDGITCVIWNGPEDCHGTLKTKCAPGFTLLGTSVQVCKPLVTRIQKYISTHDNLVSGINE